VGGASGAEIPRRRSSKPAMWVWDTDRMSTRSPLMLVAVAVLVLWIVIGALVYLAVH
jgi:hypothetical protein